MKYKPTIGLEVHAELKTKTKMFCDSLNDPDEKHPNTNVCPVCLGHPGALPTINKKAVEAVLIAGLALGGEVSKQTKFDRKNYFYPDLPKGYQISQYDKPLVLGGELNGIKIHRVHLEEDAGKLMHSEDRKSTLVDFNRAGVPLMELVTEPDIHSAEDAVSFMKELQLIFRYLGVSDADLERGQMRADANISVSLDSKLGTRTEVKNLNSFNSIFSAINYEIKRQSEILEKGGSIDQETRKWDDAKKTTIVQRSKEEAHDYRYFPEPDLPPLDTSIFDLDEIKRRLPELPKEKRARFASEYGLKQEQVETITGDLVFADFFEEAASELKLLEPSGGYSSLANYLLSDLRGLLNEFGSYLNESKIEPERLAHLVALIGKSKISSRQAKDILRKMFETGLDPEEIISAEGFELMSDESSLKTVIAEVIKENESAVSDYKKGKEQALQFLVGKSMAKTKGQGSPEKLRELIKNILK